MSRRDQIKMTGTELDAFLDQQRVLVCAANGRRGWPHLMPLWYVVRNRDIWSWTYAKSQKVRNLERDDRVTLQVETGHEYHELCGVMIRARCMLHRELQRHPVEAPYQREDDQRDIRTAARANREALHDQVLK